MEYNPRSIYQSYKQYGEQKKKQAKKGGLGSGRGDFKNEAKIRQKNYNENNSQANVEKNIWSTAAKWMGLSGGRNDEPEKPAPNAMKLYERKEFDIRNTPVVTSYLDDTGSYDEVGIDVVLDQSKLRDRNFRKFGTSMGIDPVTGRDFRDLPQNTYSKTMAGIVSGTGGRDIAVQTASPRKPGVKSYGPNQGSTGGPEEPPIESLINTINVGEKKAGLGQPSSTYKVQKGDTLSEIARDFGTTVEKLVKINDLKDKSGDTIYTGQTLKITDKVNEALDAKEAAKEFTDNPEFKYYQSGVPLDQRIYEPETGFEGMGPDPSVGQGIMSKDYDTVEKAQERLNDLGYTTLLGPLDVDGDLGPGTARQLRKFQKTAGIPVTGELDTATQKALKNNNNRNIEGKDPTAVTQPLQDGLFAIARPIIAQIESGGEVAKGRDPYLVAGGANKAYDGKFQLGEDAKNTIKTMRDENGELIFTAAEIAKLDHDNNRADFRNDKELQEKAFRQLTEHNHDTLTKNSAKYRAMDQANQLAVLGYAHNQGAENALEWLTTEVVGTDAFGTKGDKYSKAITEVFTKDDMLG